MKVIVAGSRSICNYSFVSASIDSSGFLISEIISGVAKGVDLLGEKYAREHNIPIKQFDELLNMLELLKSRIVEFLVDEGKI